MRYKRYLQSGYAGLADPAYRRISAWNQLPPAEKGCVVELALERPDLSCRELTCYIVDNEHWFVSESTVYRILKSRGLITTPAYRLMEAADQFYNPTTTPNQLWQTDFTARAAPHQRYHESLENVRPADAYWGRQEQIVAERQKTKQLSMLKRRKNHIFQRLQST
ncbi:helix-turn-helix domain-containing protein [Spirosoma validum]|uniref:helix-turn-helix domain-containing protein n=1 Tax=Spirosoma validum TaxID=2771355 RepID=UPI003743898C